MEAKYKLHPQQENAGNGISGPQHFKIFWGGGMPPDPPSCLQLRLITNMRQLEILVTALKSRKVEYTNSFPKWLTEIKVGSVLDHHLEGVDQTGLKSDKLKIHT